MARLMGWLCAGFCAIASLPLMAQAGTSPAGPVELDHVVAVVNDEVILASDLENEMHLSVLEPNPAARARETQADALQRLISRVLIRQQMREEEGQGVLPSAQELAERLEQLRRELPECMHLQCETDAGWHKFLAAHDLTEQQVEKYLQSRLEILHFIELRFRQGIRISREEVETYYRETLLPQYVAHETPPPLDQVAQRIEEILLQQRVNALFSDWLENLHKQGQIDVLDPKLEEALGSTTMGSGTQ